MRRFLGFIVVTLLVVPALAQSKHPFTFEDMMALKRVGEPIVSPDGKWVVYCMGCDFLIQSRIYMLPVTGGEAKQLEPAGAS